MYQKGGINPKKKKMTPAEREAEMTKMAGVAKERLEEMAGEKAYLAKRKVADREYKQALKEGATPEQAAKIAEKYLSQGGKMSVYENGGKIVGPKKKDKVTKLTPEYIKQQEGFAKATYKSHMDGLKKMGKDVNARTKYEGELKALKSMYTDLDYASLSDKDKAAVDKHKKDAMKFVFSSVPAYLKGGQVKLDANKDGKITGADFKMLKLKKK